MVNYDAKGIKLFNIATGRWSDLEVVPNSDHFRWVPVRVMFKVYVPTICIPAGFEGYVRIPLTDENSPTPIYPKNSQHYFAMFLVNQRVCSPVTVYYDDFGLVTYEGDQAPSMWTNP